MTKRSVAKKGPIVPDLTPLQSKLQSLLVGQPEAIDAIVPFVEMYQAGLNPEGRPVGVVLLMGPTGVGKTRTVEALAECLHGSSRYILKVDCGEYQLEHDIAKLVGANPGYVGHRETPAFFSQGKLDAVASEKCPLSIILFDEIEKAAPSVTRMLLGVMDKAILRLGDNTTVNFERCIIFLTSNLGAKSIGRILKPDFGFESMSGRKGDLNKLANIGKVAAKKKFTPEFVNRIDATITYKPLNRDSTAIILTHILASLSWLVKSRLDIRAFHIGITDSATDKLLDLGTSTEYGARELKRTVQRNFIQPLAALVARGLVPPGCTMTLDYVGGEFEIVESDTKTRHRARREELAA